MVYPVIYILVTWLEDTPVCVVYSFIQVKCVFRSLWPNISVKLSTLKRVSRLKGNTPECTKPYLRHLETIALMFLV